MRRHLFTSALLAASFASTSAQSFFTAPPTYLEPGWRGGGGTEFSQWDVFYSPFSSINYPDVEAPNGSGDFASSAGFTPPANSNPGDPFAFWHAANPALRQVLLPSAFILAPGLAGNIYSPSGVTGFELTDATPFTLGTVVLQWQTDGQLIDFSTLRLVTPGGTEIAPANFLTEYQSSGSPFGGLLNRTAAQWNLTGLGLASYTVKFTSEGTSVSLQELLLDTAPTYTEAVASARIWTAATGAWSAGANWFGGTVGPLGGNIVFASGTGATIDGGTREIGELKLTAPGGFSLGASGGGSLKVNTGLTAAPASPASYTVSTRYEMGSFNFMELAAGATVTLAGEVSGPVGLLKLGSGTLRLTADNSFSGSVSVSAGTLEISGLNTYTGGTAVNGGRIVLRGHAPSGSAGTLGAATSPVPVGAGAFTPQPEAAVLIKGAFTVGRNFTLLNGTDVKILGGQNTGTGATFSGNIALQSTASNVRLHAENGGDLVTFTGAITGSAGRSLTKTGAGTVVLDGSNQARFFNLIVAEGTLQFTQSMTLQSLHLGGGSFASVAADAFASPDSTVVPEPSAALLLVSSTALLLRRRRPAARKS